MNWKHQAIRHSRKQRYPLLLSLYLIGNLEVVAQGPGGFQGNVRGGWELALTEENQISTRFRGESIEGDLLKGVSIEFFSPDQQEGPSYIVQAPNCIMDPVTHDAYSPEKISLQSGDGGVQMSGVGWHWSHGSSELTISNRVTTVIKKAYLESATKPQQAPQADSNITVQSRQLVFKRQQGLALFSRDVSILDPGTLQLNCQTLTLTLTSESSGFREIKASGEVAISLLAENLPVTARSGRAIYQARPDSEGQLELMDAPYWNHAGGASGNGNLIRMEKAENGTQFVVMGQAYLALEMQKFDLKSNPKASLEQSSEPVIVHSQTYSLNNDEVIFLDAVTAVQGADWKLSCEKLVSGWNRETSQIQYLEATRDVRWTQSSVEGEVITSCERARYTPGEEEDYTLELEDHASVTTRGYVAKGNTITMEQAGKQQRMHVAGNGYLEMPVDTFNEMRLFKTSDAPPSQAPDKTNPIKIRADQYAFADGKGAFTGEVHVEWNDTQMTCRKLDTDYDVESQAIRSLVATGEVAFQQGDGVLTCHSMHSWFSPETGQLEGAKAQTEVLMEHPNGKASGDEAVFNPLTQLIELKGDPRILAKLPSTRNDGGKYVLAEGGRLFWNQARNRLSGRGDYQIQTLEQAEKW